MSSNDLLAKGAASSTGALTSGAGSIVLWVVLGLAAAFVGYLLVDAFLAWRRAQRLRALIERSRQLQAEASLQESPENVDASHGR